MQVQLVHCQDRSDGYSLHNFILASALKVL
jgi:hypothetical protein